MSHRTGHRIEEVDFSEGYLRCCCGAELSEPDDPAGDRAEGLASAWREHRAKAGLRTAEYEPRKSWSLRSAAVEAG